MAAACVSTEGLDVPATDTPDAAAQADTSTPEETGATLDQSSPPLEDATPPGVDVATDGGGKLEDLRADFAAPLDPTLWYQYFVAPFSSSQASEQLHIFCPTKVTNKFAYVRTLRWFDATSSSVRLNLVTAGNAGISSETNLSYFWLKLLDAKSSGSAVEIGVAVGDIYAKHFVANVGTHLASKKYLPATMAFLRLSTTTGAIVWEHAQTANGPWETLFSEAPQMALDTVTVEIGVGAFPGTPGEIIVDSLNVP
jgi:hypothetical protein